MMIFIFLSIIFCFIKIFSLHFIFFSPENAGNEYIFLPFAGYPACWRTAWDETAAHGVGLKLE